MTLASNNADNKVAIAAHAGAILHLVALVERGDAAGKAFAAGALMTLASNADNQVAIAQAGAIPHLVALVERGDAAGKAYAAGALRNLAVDNADNQVTIAQFGAIPHLVSLASRGDKNGNKNAIQALEQLAFTEANWVLISRLFKNHFIVHHKLAGLSLSLRALIP